MNKKYRLIDIQSHFLPERWVEEMKKRSEYPFLQKINEDRWLIRGSDFDMLPYHVKGSAVDIKMKLREMDDNGVDLTLLSLSPPSPDTASDPAEADRLAKISNDGIAEIVHCYPDRFRGIANLGYGNMEASADELRRCIDKLNFVGLQMYPYAQGGIGIQDPAFRSVFKILDEKRIPLILHPGSPVNKDYGSYMMGPLLGYWFDDAMAMLKLILSGLFEEFPNLKVVCPHVWSALPYLIDRIDVQVSRFPQYFTGKIKKAPSEYLKNVFTDCNHFSVDTLGFAIKKMGGVDKMMFGSDSPFVEVGFIKDLIFQSGLSEENQNKIFYKNAEKFFLLND
jgi:predicted TIM-barrel fold metal-dependent hydrolase